MRLMEQTGRGFAVRTAITLLAVSTTVLLTMRLGNAVPGGATRDALSFAGTLRRNGQVPTEPVRLMFRFRRGATVVCEATTQPVQPAAGSGAFSVEVPLGACPAGMFDGDDLAFDVSAGSEVIASDQRVNPVPYAKYADRVGTADCPVGYERDLSEASIVLCRKCRGPGRFENCYDDVVRVGTGATAFWIDRYEASVWATETAAPESRRGESTADYESPPTSVPRHGDYTGGSLFARSTIGVIPSSRLTWFQAQAFCFASGKRLPSLHQWQLAIRGTREPEREEFGDGRDRRCLTNVSRVQPTGNRNPTSGTIGCQSVWGAQDMIGNLREWADDWIGTVVISPDVDASVVDFNPWPAGYPQDLMANITSYASSDGNGTRRRVPAAILVGGGYPDGLSAGLLYLVAGSAPSDWNGVTGFRCVIPR